MGGEAETIGIAEARSALAWWLEAGVDVAVQEEPRNWLKRPRNRARDAAEPAPAPNIVQPSHETLAELRDWLGEQRTIADGVGNAPDGSSRTGPKTPR